MKSADAHAMLTLEIEKPTAGGRMLARHNGQIVLVWGAIPGERVRARIERTGKGVLYAETADVLLASPDRREAVTDWRCGGNVLAHVAYPRQLHLKADIIRDAFARVARMPLANPPVIAGSPEHGYRMRARFHVSGGRIGFLREGSHELCPVGQTGQMLPATVAWIAAAEERLQREGLTGVTSIEIAENIPASNRVCHLELEAGAIAARFAGLAGNGLTGLSAQVLDRGRVEQLSGVPEVSDLVRSGVGDGAAQLRLQRDARAFFQGNRYVLEDLVGRVVSLVPAGPVVDAYAGVGLFGLSLSAQGLDDVILVEGDAVSGRCLQENARPYADRVRVERKSVEEFVGSRPTLRGDATFIVDPPRTGMSKEVLQGLGRISPKRIVYVSCDVATLARDVRTLVTYGYAVEGLSGIDLFPNTAHVESICSLGRS